MQINIDFTSSKKPKDVLIDNAFLFLANKDRILTDPKMALAVTGLSCHLFAPADILLAPILNWWSQNSFFENGKKVLVHTMVGSPLTGSNACVGVDLDGEEHYRIYVDGFLGVYRRLSAQSGNLIMNKDYKKLIPYKLEEVADILRHDYEALENLKRFKVECLLEEKTKEFSELTNSYETLQRKYSELEDSYIVRTIEYNKDAFLAFNKFYIQEAKMLNGRRAFRNQIKKEYQAKRAAAEITYKEFDTKMKCLKRDKEIDRYYLQNIAADFLKRYFPERIFEKYTREFANTTLIVNTEEL